MLLVGGRRGKGCAAEAALLQVLRQEVPVFLLAGLELVQLDADGSGVVVSVVGEELGRVVDGPANSVYDHALELDGNDVLVALVVGRVDHRQPVRLGVRIQSGIDVSQHLDLVLVHELLAVAAFTMLFVLICTDQGSIV